MSTACGAPDPHRPARGHESGGRPAAVRASDAEREETVAVLHQALGEGRLDLEETDTRMTAAYAARHRHELAALLADLPAPGDTDRRSVRAGRPAALVVAGALGLGLLGGVTLGGLGVLTAQAAHHGGHRDGLHGPAWSHQLEDRGGGAGPVSFWLPPRGV